MSMSKNMPDVLARKAGSPAVFNAIASRYDLLNYILSFGMDIGWRREMGRYLPPGDGLRVLDLATGTGDVAIALARRHRSVREVVGLDLAEGMLCQGRAKVAMRNLTGRVRLERADALAIPFEDGIFDAVVVAFGLRNMPDVARVLMEVRRVLVPGGRLVALEFSRPHNLWVRPFHSAYLLWMVPLIGYALTGNREAYHYLSRTAMDFPYGERMQKIIRQVGLENVSKRELALGAATIYVAELVRSGQDGDVK